MADTVINFPRDTTLKQLNAIPQHHLQCLYPAYHQAGVLWSRKPQRDHHAPEAAEGEG